jgi:hypothetical protein
MRRIEVDVVIPSWVGTSCGDINTKFNRKVRRGTRKVRKDEMYFLSIQEPNGVSSIIMKVGSEGKALAFRSKYPTETEALASGILILI